jgi:Tol biopolymer transport system component
VEIALSDDGRTVLFTSRLPLVPEDVNGRVDVYVRDLVASTTALVTRNAAGSPLAGGGWHGGLSGDGSHAVFFSSSDDIGPAGGSDRRGFYRRNLTTGAIDTIYFTSGDPYAGAPSSVDVSTTGDRVVYSDTVVSLWDADEGETTVVSRNLQGEVKDAAAGVISGDGTTVAFASDQRDFVSGDDRTGFLFHEAYVYDVSTAQITLGSVNYGDQFGGAGYFGGSSSPTGLSDDGRYLALDSDSGWLIPGDDSNWENDVFIRDLAASP